MIIQSAEHDLEDQVSLDINNYCLNFPNKQFALRILAQETGLNVKTLSRLLARKNKPTYQTLYKLYSALFQEENYEKLVTLCPEVVKQKMSTCAPDKTKYIKKTKDTDLLKLFKSNPLSIEIFVLVSISGLDKSAIAYKYGEYGVNVIDKLIEIRLVNEVKKGHYRISENTPILDAESLKLLGEYFTRHFSKLGNTQLHCQNVINFYAESLNEEGIKAWLAIDTEAYKQKRNIANNSSYKGNIPMFTFNSTDTIVREKINVH